MHLLSVQILWMKFMIILIVTIQTEEEKSCFLWYDCGYYDK